MTRISIQSGLALLAVVAAIGGCGGGGGGSDGGPGGVMPVAQGSSTGAAPGATSSGTITAFGSVFVNGHEFNIEHAKLMDDDDPTSTPAAGSLEVGMSVDVKAAADSSDAHPSAEELHLHPLARGYVDASDTAAGTVTVMGQKAQLTAATSFSDRRACVTAATSPCAAITGQSGLLATTGRGTGAMPGSYVTVHGYLFAAGSGGANIVATLVAVRDVPAAPGPVAFKAEGTVSSASGTTVTIGGLGVDLSAAKCFVARQPASCSGAFSAGQVVSAVGSVAPALPAAIFKAGAARSVNALLVESAGTAVEVEGRVSSVTTAPAGFVVRGIRIDASTLASGTLPAVGDIVEVTGTVGSDGKSVIASAVRVEHPAHAATFGFEGDAGTVSAGSSANIYALALLGQSITVNANTRLSDLTRPDGDVGHGTNPFNITTFPMYLAASASKHVLVRTQADGTGALTALSVSIVPPSTASSVGGVVDATPAPANASVGGGKPTTFAVHGLAVSADPATIVSAASFEMDGGAQPVAPHTVAAGDRVLVRGTYGSGGIVVALPPSGHGDIVIDFGPPGSEDHDDF
jgi:hypothetical protein